MKSIFDVPSLFRNKIRSSRTISNEEEARKNPEIRISWRNYPRLIPSLKENHGRGFSWCVMVKRRSISFREPRHREESVARLGSFWLIGQYSLLAPRGSCITRRDVEKLPDWDAPINNPRVHSSSLRSYTHACNYSRNATWNWTPSFVDFQGKIQFPCSTNDDQDESLRRLWVRADLFCALIYSRDDWTLEREWTLWGHQF